MSLAALPVSALASSLLGGEALAATQLNEFVRLLSRQPAIRSVCIPRGGAGADISRRCPAASYCDTFALAPNLRQTVGRHARWGWW